MTESERIRLLMVDDHHVVRLGLMTLLGHYPDIDVVGQAATVKSAVEETGRLLPDLILMDVRLPDGNGFDACRQIRARHPNVRVLFLTSFADEQTVLESIQAGADGYLLKEIDESTLIAAIRDVVAGKSILDPAITRRVLEQARSPGTPSGRERWSTLSPQERRVVAAVAQGLTNKEIGLNLGLSDKTVKNYLSNVLDKLELTRRSQVAAFHAQHGSGSDHSALRP